MRALLAVLLLVLGQSAPGWQPAPGGGDLTRAVFWEDFEPADGPLTIGPTNGLYVNRFGPRLPDGAAVRLEATLQAVSDEVAALALVDDADHSVAFGLDHGRVVFGDESFDSDTPVGPVTLAVSRVGADLALEVSGREVARMPDPFTGPLRFGARVGAGNALTVHALSMLGQPGATASVTRCAPERLLVAGSNAEETLAGLWWYFPDDGHVRQIESSPQRSFLVAPSPDLRWVAYYQRSSTDLSDRFVVDTWVIDAATDERHKLVEGNAPRAWNAESRGVMLGERPYLMATVPGGELVPTEGPLISSDGTRTVMSPDGQLRATVATSSRGSVALELFDAGQSDPFLSIPTGLAQIQMAWSPDSTRLAYVSSMAGRDGIVWRLRMVDVASRTAEPVEATLDLHLHSVVWLPATPGC